MPTKQVKSLIQLTKSVNFKTHKVLTNVEDEIAKNYKVIKIKKDDELDKEAMRYLLFTSLPYTLTKNNVDAAELWSGPRKCELCIDTQCHKKALPVGNVHPEWIVIGDAPGEGGEFDCFNRAWVGGPSSQLLRKALFANKVYHKTWFSNLLKCATPGNRKSYDEEIDNCERFLKKELEILKPKKAIILGKHAQEKCMKLEIPSFNIYHPAYFVRNGKDYKLYAKHIKEVIE